VLVLFLSTTKIETGLQKLRCCAPAHWRDCNIYKTFSSSNYLKVWGLAEGSKTWDLPSAWQRE